MLGREKDALDLLAQLLMLDPSKRITADEVHTRGQKVKRQRELDR